MAKVLIACEYSGTVRDEFLNRGHDAWSCDIRESETRPDRHIRGDVRPVLDHDWDLVIAHPPCTRLANSGVWYLKKHQLWDELNESAAFFRLFLRLTHVPFVAIENPIPHGYAVKRIGRKYDQIVQPYEYGEDMSKATCLWLKGLPKLEPTKYVEPRIVNGRKVWGNQTPSGQNKLGPSENRAKERARFPRGIARAMAQQWEIDIIQWVKEIIR